MTHSHDTHPFSARIMRFIGRHHRRHHWGHFGGFGGPGFDDIMGGRKLAARELHLAILALLAEQPRHGYDIIKALEERSKGFYAPSPGMVYPALTYLEEIGHAAVSQEGAKKLYTITDEGRAHLAQNQAKAEAILNQLAAIGRKLEMVREFFSGDETGDHDGLSAARHDLRHAIREKRHSGEAERKRVADILRRAAAEIRRGN